MATTANYNFVKRKIGHPMRDEDMGNNLDLIDTAVKAREDESDALQKGIVTFGPIDISESISWTIEFPFEVTINKVIAAVSTTLSVEATAIYLKNHAGITMQNGAITIASEAAPPDVESASPTGSNVIGAGETLKLVSNGACTTGAVIALIHYTRSKNGGGD